MAKKSTDSERKLLAKLPSNSIIGREEEIRILQKAVAKLKLTAKRLESAKPMKTKVIVLEGEAGIGKTRLINKVEQLFQEISQPLFSGSASQLESSKPYHAWFDIFKKAIKPETRKLHPSIESELDAELLPLLNSVLPLNLEETSKIRGMGGQMRSECTQILLMKLLHHLIKPGSLIMLENAHWFDSASWGLTLSASQQLEGVLIVIAMRPIKSTSFQFSQLVHQAYATRIKLKNLTEEETSQLICSILQVKKVSDEMAKNIHEKGQGNPFMTEEIVQALRSSGSIQIARGGECTMTKEVEEALKSVPNSITGLLTSKVDRLSPSQQVVLKVGSVIGQTFTYGVLSQLLPEETDKNNLKRDLHTLESVGMIILESPDPNLSYSFANTLIKDVVYNIMLFSQRRGMHKTLANLIQKDYPGNTSYYPILAYHLKQAEDDQQAIEYFLKSGSNCLLNYSHEEAVRFFTESIQLTAKRQQLGSLESIGVERKLGTCYYNLGQLSMADEHFRKALEMMGIFIPTESKKSKEIMKTLVKVKASTWTFAAQDPSARELSNELQHRKREAILCLTALAKVHYYSGNRGLAHYCSSLAMQIVDSVGAGVSTEVFAIAALTSGINSEHENAEAYLHKGREQNSVRKQADLTKVIELMSGMYYSGVCKWDKAESGFYEALEAAKVTEDLRTVEECKVFLGTCYYYRGDVKQSVIFTGEALESAILRGDPSIQILASCAQARNYFALGEYENCLKNLIDVKVAISSSGGGDVMYGEIVYNGLMALMHLRMGEEEQSLALADLALDRLGAIEPSFYFSSIGYACITEVYVNFLYQTKLLTKLSLPRQKILAKAEKSLEILTKFCSVFSVANPRAELWKAAINFLNGKGGGKSESEWSKAVETAKYLGMFYEQAYILYYRGVICSSNSDIIAAMKLFPEIASLSKSLTSLRKQISSKDGE